MNSYQQQYITSWHDAFVDWVGKMVTLADTMRILEQATECDRRELEVFKAMMHRNDVQDVEKDLANATVKKSTLDKIEKLNKDIVDFALEHIAASPLILQFLRQVSYYQIEYYKQTAIIKLNNLQIPISDN